MGLNVLIAEPHDVLRAGLRSIFLEDSRVSNVYEAANDESLKTQLLCYVLDLLVISQSLVIEITILPRDKFVILATEPDIAILKAAYKHNARGYLSVNVSAGLLRTMLQPAENSFLIEPTLVPWIMEHIFDNTHFFVKDELLTRREKEIVRLLREGLDRASIARRLSIAEITLKTHIKNIARKRERAETHAKKNGHTDLSANI